MARQKRMKLRGIVWAVFVALSLPCAPASAQPDAVTRFRHRIEGASALPESEADPLRGFDSAAVAAAWNELDAIVLSRLRRGRDVATIGRFLRTLPGAPDEDDEVRGGYRLVQVNAPVPVVLGVYNLGTAPGRVSVFARRLGVWAREGSYDAAHPVRAYPLPAANGAAWWAAVATFTGGDREECLLTLWSYRRADVTRAPADPAPMVDCEVEAGPAAVRITFHSFPRALRTSVLGVRLSAVRTLTSGEGGPRVHDEPMNPWSHLLDHYYALQAAGQRAAALRLLARPELAALLADPEYEAAADEGDAGAGRGSVFTVRTRGDVQLWSRISVVRRGGTWLVDEVRQDGTEARR